VDAAKEAGVLMEMAKNPLFEQRLKAVGWSAPASADEKTVIPSGDNL
jgi:hypothetical protein